jgi:PIN domain nuclease of toxin-antitoxin system
MIVLDTHAWVWWAVESDRLSRKAGMAIARSDAVGVSIMSCWEVAMLVAKRRLTLSLSVDDWIARALERPRVRLLPLELKATIGATRLPDRAGVDPVDRMLVATCQHLGASLVSKDAALRQAGWINVVW